MIAIALPQEKTIVLVPEKSITTTTVNFYDLVFTPGESIVANIDYGTTDQVQPLVLWDKDNMKSLTSLTDEEIETRILELIG